MPGRYAQPHAPQVRIVKHKQTKALYALKYVDKDKCIRKRAAVNTIQERNILEELKHDFIVNLRYAFQDDDVCFFVLDLMLGGDLRQHYKFEGRFSEEVVRFWFAELSGAIAYMHSKRIVHRDIKPDNILLDAYGHVHLTDFNIAVRFEDNKPITGVAGSVAYMGACAIHLSLRRSSFDVAPCRAQPPVYATRHQRREFLA